MGGKASKAKGADVHIAAPVAVAATAPVVKSSATDNNSSQHPPGPGKGPAHLPPSQNSSASSVRPGAAPRQASALSDTSTAVSESTSVQDALDKQWASTRAPLRYESFSQYSAPPISRSATSQLSPQGDADLQSDEHIDLKNLSQQELDQMFGNIKAPSRTFSDKSLMSSLYGGGSAHSSFDSTGRPVSIDSAGSRHSRQNSSSGGGLTGRLSQRSSLGVDSVPEDLVLDRTGTYSAHRASLSAADVTSDDATSPVTSLEEVKLRTATQVEPTDDDEDDDDDEDLPAPTTHHAVVSSQETTDDYDDTEDSDDAYFQRMKERAASGQGKAKFKAAAPKKKSKPGMGARAASTSVLDRGTQRKAQRGGKNNSADDAVLGTIAEASGGGKKKKMKKKKGRKKKTVRGKSAPAMVNRHTYPGKPKKKKKTVPGFKKKKKKTAKKQIGQHLAGLREFTDASNMDVYVPSSEDEDDSEASWQPRVLSGKVKRRTRSVADKVAKKKKKKKLRKKKAKGSRKGSKK